MIFDKGELPDLFTELRVVPCGEPIKRADFEAQVMKRLVRYSAERLAD